LPQTPPRGRFAAAPPASPGGGGKPPAPHGHILHNTQKGTADCASDNGDLVRWVECLDRSNAGVRERQGITPPSAQALFSSVLF